MNFVPANVTLYSTSWHRRWRRYKYSGTWRPI